MNTIKWIKNNMKEKTNKVYMKFSNGYQHRITILKDPIQGYKYLGISQKLIKSHKEDKKHDIQRN